jgi:hypothetical protein
MDPSLKDKPLHERHMGFAAACKAYKDAGLPLTDKVIADLAEAWGVPAPQRPKPPPTPPPMSGGGLVFGGSGGF